MPRRTRSGTSVAVEQLAVQPGGDDRGDHCAFRRRRAPSCVDPCGPASVEAMCSTGAAQRISPPSDASRRAKRLGQLAGPAPGTGKPTVCPIMLMQERHQARAGGVQGDVGVASVAGEQEARCVPAEPVGVRGRRPASAGRGRARSPPAPAQAGQAAERRPARAGTA